MDCGFIDSLHVEKAYDEEYSAKEQRLKISKELSETKSKIESLEEELLNYKKTLGTIKQVKASSRGLFLCTRRRCVDKQSDSLVI